MTEGHKCGKSQLVYSGVTSYAHLTYANSIIHVGFEVFTAVGMKNIIFWDMTPCSPLSCTRRSAETLGGTQRTTRRHIPEDDTLLSIILARQKNK
jgi:hypothetical protein